MSRPEGIDRLKAKLINRKVVQGIHEYLDREDREIPRELFPTKAEDLRSEVSLRRKIGVKPSKKYWRSTRSTDFDTRARARNYVMEYMQSFWQYAED